MSKEFNSYMATCNSPVSMLVRCITVWNREVGLLGLQLTYPIEKKVISPDCRFSTFPGKSVGLCATTRKLFKHLYLAIKIDVLTFQGTDLVQVMGSFVGKL